MILVKTPPKPSNVEVFVWVYTFTFGCDKIREVTKHLIVEVLCNIFKFFSCFKPIRQDFLEN
jgi:hypothetical protein